MEQGFEYSSEYFIKCLIETSPYIVTPAKSYSDDGWYQNQQLRQFIENPGYTVINPGQAKGRIVGGNISSFCLLNGTKYFPDLNGSILFLEAYFETYAELFNRLLHSIILQPGFSGVQGLVIGRFQKESNVSDDALIEIIRSKKELRNIPIIANANFGHTTPQFSFPIGGNATLSCDNRDVKLAIEAP